MTGPPHGFVVESSLQLHGTAAITLKQLPMAANTLKPPPSTLQPPLAVVRTFQHLAATSWSPANAANSCWNFRTATANSCWNCRTAVTLFLSVIQGSGHHTRLRPPGSHHKEISVPFVSYCFPTNT
ncbi:unnamed protein product [Prunus armeniaca]